MIAWHFMALSWHFKNCDKWHRRNFPMSSWHGIGIYIGLLPYGIVATNVAIRLYATKGRKLPLCRCTGRDAVRQLLGGTKR